MVVTLRCVAPALIPAEPSIDDLITLHPPGDFHTDPWRAVDRAVISQA
jgi:hypothetical protein